MLYHSLEWTTMNNIPKMETKLSCGGIDNCCRPSLGTQQNDIVCTQLVLLPNHMHTYHKILLISVYSSIPQIWLMSFLLQSTTCLLMSSNGTKSTNTQLTELNFAVTSSHVDLSIAHCNAYSIVKVMFIINHSKVF